MGTAQDQNRHLVSQYFDAYDRQDKDRIGQLVSNSYFLHLAGMRPMDRNGTKQFYEEAWKSFPDLHHEILDLVMEGDKVAVRYNIIGTHKGEFQGLKPSGRKVSFSAMAFIRLIDGKVAEEWEIADTMGLMQQIGAINLPPSTEH
jgi:steroid delta-isomerase-like uncharacterized protein